MDVCNETLSLMMFADLVLQRDLPVTWVTVLWRKRNSRRYLNHPLLHCRGLHLEGEKVCTGVFLATKVNSGVHAPVAQQDRKPLVGLPLQSNQSEGRDYEIYSNFFTAIFIALFHLVFICFVCSYIVHNRSTCVIPDAHVGSQCCLLLSKGKVALHLGCYLGCMSLRTVEYSFCSRFLALKQQQTCLRYCYIGAYNFGCPQFVQVKICKFTEINVVTQRAIAQITTYVFSYFLVMMQRLIYLHASKPDN